MNEYHERLRRQVTQKLNNGIPLSPRETMLYYNFKYPTQVIRYWGRALPGRKERIETDLRDFVTADNYIVKELVQKIISPNDSNNVKAMKIQKWVIDNLTYVSDEKQTGFVEFWQFPFETLHLKSGDCEDGSILMATMMIAAGIPRWQVRIGAGLVVADPVTAATGGHAYCCYLRESASGYMWIALDWCYLPDTAEIENRVALKDNKNYIKTWFSWNDIYTWGDTSFQFDSIDDLIK